MNTDASVSRVACRRLSRLTQMIAFNASVLRDPAEHDKNIAP